MQENSEVQGIRPSFFFWYTSIIFFLIVWVGLIWLYSSIYYTNSLIKQEESQIAEIQKSIDTANSDRKMLVVKIIMNNDIRPSLDLKWLIAQFRLAASKAWVTLNGFSIQNDTISTTLVATMGDAQVHPDPASTIIAMMQAYAKEKQYFSLSPILSMAGDLSKRTTAIQLKVNPGNQ